MKLGSQTQLQPIYDSILVEVESEWQGEIKGKNGIIGVVLENEIDRSVGAQRKGCVVRVPRQISDHHYLKLTTTEVKEGDTVYLHFNSILEDSRVQRTINDKMFYLVHMENIFCVVRDGAIIMFGDRVLCEPIFDDDIETLENGMKVKKSKSGIIAEINVSHNLKKAKIAHIGTGLSDRPNVDVKVGDTIYYDVDADFKNVIEGKEYFCMTQEDLLMKEE